MSNTAQIILLYVTFPNMEEARAVAHKIVTEKLAACANILPQMISVYEWKGKMEEENEVVAIFKTKAEKQSDIIERIKMLHSYDIPAVIVLDSNAGNPDFLNWVSEQTG